MAARPINVCFTPKSGHQMSALECPLCANSGLAQCSNWDARSLWIEKKNTLRIVERPRLEAREKRLTK